MKDNDFLILKSLVSNCICKAIVLAKSHIDDEQLNLLSNKYTDLLINEVKRMNGK